MILTFWSVFLGCNDAGFAAVAITPIYGWVDGCNAITLTGHGFSKDIAVKIGGSSLEDSSGTAGAPAWPDNAKAQGYEVSGYVPAAVAKGFVDISVTSGGEATNLTGTAGYYYVDCPLELGYADATTVCGQIAGATVEVSGCNLDVSKVQVMIVDADGAPAIPVALPLVSTCRDGRATFAAPDLAEGLYYAEIVDLGGAVVAGAPCTAVTQAYAECGATAPEGSSSGDTADTGGAACVDFPIYYGGAQ